LISDPADHGYGAMIVTRFTEMFDLRHPIALAPMGGVAGGSLAAAVSEAGALGLVGGGYGDAAWLRTELALVKQRTRRAWGVGLITWSIDRSLVELVLGFRPHAVMLSFGDPAPYASLIRSFGCKLICQVQDLDAAHQAKAAGADLIVAQGTEAGGHGGGRATLPLVPAVVDAVEPTPVLAAGGVADGRGVAAALMLGAAGALIGTRFYASEESLAHEKAKTRVAEAKGNATARTRVFDTARGLAWPQAFAGRALRNRFMERWQGRESEAAADAAAYRAAVRDGDFDTAVVWAGEAIDLIPRVERAAALVLQIGEDAASHLRRGARLALPTKGSLHAY
jgi:nitronate monooxygenase